MNGFFPDQHLLTRIRSGEAAAWQELIEGFEGRLIAFANSRLKDRSTAEDVVQEAFIGFLNALPNYDGETPLESFLFAITSHKITDVLRRRGRRPALYQADESGDSSRPDSRARVASSLARSRERQSHEANLISGVMRPVISECLARGQYQKLKCLELLFVRGLPNKQVANTLGLTEQDVANQKHALLSRLKSEAGRLKVSLDERWLI